MLQNLAKKNRSVANGIAKEALDLLVGYSWPGNVRELENIVHRSAVLAQGNTILPKDLPTEINAAESEEPLSETTDGDAVSTNLKSKDEEVDFQALYNGLCQLTNNENILKKLEAELIKQALDASKGVVAKAAKVLGMTASTLKKRITEYDIQ